MYNRKNLTLDYYLVYCVISGIFSAIFRNELFNINSKTDVLGNNSSTVVTQSY